MCDVVAMLPQQRTMDVLREQERKNASRDGAPKLSGEKTRGNLAFQKRKRVGPHR